MRVKNLLPLSVKILISEICILPLCNLFFRVKFIIRIRKIHLANKKAIIIMATPIHGNLGDQAIVYAEIRLLKELFLDNQVIEIPNKYYNSQKTFIKKYVCHDDLILIDGGGNLGTLWPIEDDKISQIINDYRDNSIIVFPQTCFYVGSDTEKRLQTNQKIYSSANSLTVTLRDRTSYDFFIQKFCNVKCVLIPDIVLSLKPSFPFLKRNGVLLCFRSDKERMLPEEDANTIKNFILNHGFSFMETSTIVDFLVSSKNREKVLFDKWLEFSSAKLVITDRLHGMIFSIISHTPCLAMDNISKKVSGVYSLLPQSESVRICNDKFDVLDSIVPFYEKDFDVNEYNLHDNYQDLKLLINEIL